MRIVKYAAEMFVYIFLLIVTLAFNDYRVENKELFGHVKGNYFSHLVETGVPTLTFLLIVALGALVIGRSLAFFKIFSL